MKNKFIQRLLRVSDGHSFVLALTAARLNFSLCFLGPQQFYFYYIELEVSCIFILPSPKFLNPLSSLILSCKPAYSFIFFPVVTCQNEVKSKKLVVVCLFPCVKLQVQ